MSLKSQKYILKSSTLVCVCVYTHPCGNITGYISILERENAIFSELVFFSSLTYI